MLRQRNEAELLVVGGGLFVFCIDQHRMKADFFGEFEGDAQGVGEQVLADALALPAAIHGKAAYAQDGAGWRGNWGLLGRSTAAIWPALRVTKPMTF